MDRSRLLEALLESAPDALLAVDGAGRILLANAQAERLFGYPRDEFVGTSVDELVPYWARAVHPDRRARYAENPVARPMGMGMELAARRKDGTEFPAEISLSALETDGGLVVSAAVRDVTERLEARAEREELRARAEREELAVRMERAERLEALGHLAGGVAHDFNNLLGAILNFAAFVDADLSQLPVPEERVAPLHADLREIRRAAERGAELTRQLLAFGRRETGSAQVVDVDDLVEGVHVLLRRTLGEQVELRTVHSGRAANVLADPGQLEQVLVNLAVNARDAMSGGGRLVIEVAVHDAADAGRGTVTVAVSDTGVGMPPEVQAHAVEPFFTTKAPGEGTGLGLATVYGIVTGFGGELHIDSAPGEGTVVQVVLPLVEATVEPRPSAPVADRTTAHGTVLVVEDEPALREVTRRVLERAGYLVVVAPSGAQAVELVESGDVELDLLLTDVVMPGLSGPEVATRVAAVRPEAAVLFMSGYTGSALEAAGPPGKEAPLLAKPFTEDQLLVAVHGALAASLGDAAVGAAPPEAGAGPAEASP